MTGRPRAAAVASILGWARAHPIPAALAAVGAAVLTGVMLSLAIGAVRSDGVAGPPDASPTPLATLSPVPTPTEAPTPTPAASPSPPIPTPSAGISSPAPSATPEPSSEPVNGRIAWDGPGPTSGQVGNILSANPDGSDLQILTLGPAEEWSPVWSPDGQWLAYTSTAAGGSVEVLRGDGPAVVVHAGSYPRGVVWSPDSSHLALALQGGVAVVDLDGVVTAYMSAGEPHYVAWSPTGAQVAFADGNTIMVGDTLTSVTRIATNQNSTVRSLTWTHDGRTILFHSYSEDSTDLFALELDGSTVRNVTASKDLYELSPTLSPDGRHVAFITLPDRAPHYLIQVFELDGGERRTLHTVSDDGSISWAPDGTALVVGIGNTITVVPVDGSAAIDIGTGREPSWGRAP